MIMNIIISIFEIVRTITFYLVFIVAFVLCYNILAYIFGLNFPGKSGRALMVSFGLLIALLVIDNMVFSIYHVHIINTKIALGSIPDPIF